MEKKNENTTTKKPFYKKWWFLVIVGIVLVSAVFGPDEENGNTMEDNNSTLSIVETTDNAANTVDDETNEHVQQEGKLVFELVAGQQGEYGKMISYNKGTEFEENFYAFYIPAGTYKVTNTGEYMSQLNIYSNEIAKNEDGWDEPAEVCFIKVLDVNGSVIVTVEEGQHIEIAEPSSFTFEQQ